MKLDITRESVECMGFSCLVGRVYVCISKNRLSLGRGRYFFRLVEGDNGEEMVKLQNYTRIKEIKK